MTFAEAEAHQRKHGFDLRSYTKKELATGKVDFDAKPKKSKDEMNKTERDYSFILEARKRRGEIISYQFEGITLRLADDCKFTPDFFVVVSMTPLLLRFCETKGRHIWDDAKVKFRVARELHSWAEWELHQKNKDGWIRLL